VCVKLTQFSLEELKSGKGQFLGFNFLPSFPTPMAELTLNPEFK